MKDITVSIPDNEYPFFIKLIKQFSFVTIKEMAEAPPSKQQFTDGLREAAEEVIEIKAGRIQGQSLKDFLNELKCCS